MTNWRGLIVVLGLVGLSLPSAAQSTIIKIGVPTGRPNDSAIDGLELNTGQIDAVISGAQNAINSDLNFYGIDAGVNVFPANFTSNQLNSLFGELDQLTVDLENEIRAALLQDNDVRRVNFLNIDSSRLRAELTQNSLTLTASISGFAASGSVDVNVPSDLGLCSPAEATFSLDQLAVESTFNAFTGALQDTEITYRLLDEDVDGGGLFCEIAEAIAGIFTTVDGRVSNEIDAAIADLEMVIDMQAFFGIRDIFDAVQTFAENSSLFPNQTQIAEDAIDAGLRFLGTANLNTGLLIRADVFNSSSVSVPNRVTLAVAHQTPLIRNVGPNGSFNFVSLDLPPRTQSTTIFANAGVVGTTTGTIIQFPTPGEGVNLRAVSTSDFIPGLKSFASPVEKALAPCFTRRSC